MNRKGVVHIVDRAGRLAEKADLFAALELVPYVHRSPLEFLREFTHAEPCCVISAMRMAEMAGFELLALLQKLPVPPPVIIVTAFGSVETAVQAMKLGAAEFLETPVHDEPLLRLVQKWVNADRFRQSKANTCTSAREKLSKLSAREREVLTGIINGKCNKEMASSLGISAKSIEVYRAKLMTKMEATPVPMLVQAVLCCPLFQCSPLEYGYLCTGSGCLSNNSAHSAAIETGEEIHFSRIEYAGSKYPVNSSRGAPNHDR